MASSDDAVSAWDRYVAAVRDELEAERDYMMTTETFEQLILEEFPRRPVEEVHPLEKYL